MEKQQTILEQFKTIFCPLSLKSNTFICLIKPYLNSSLHLQQCSLTSPLKRVCSLNAHAILLNVNEWSVGRVHLQVPVQGLT